MSLQHAAKHLESKGRNGDDMLVHMSKGEVKSLQKLAEAHGGSLSINPDTGLPEAGFLRAIMPTVIGAAVGVATQNPYLGAAAAGAYGYSETGTITGGLMAGMQGYGGAGLVDGMTVGAAGTQLAPGQAADIAAQQELARQQVTQQALNTSQNAGLNELAVHAGENVGDSLARGINGTGVELGTISPSVSPYSGSLTAGPSLEQAQMEKFLGANGGAEAYTNAVTNNVANTQYMNPYTNTAAEAYGTGANSIANNAASGVNTGATGAQMDAMTNGQYGGPAAKSNWDILNKNATFKNLSYALGPAVVSEMMQKPQTAAPNTPKPHGTSVAPTFTMGQNTTGDEPVDMSGRGRRWLNPSYTPGVYYAAGGTVEQMSDQNAIGASTGYPQSNINTSAYAVPYQSPVSSNVLNGAQDVRVDPYTGAEKFASGGVTTAQKDYLAFLNGSPVSSKTGASTVSTPAMRAARQARMNGNSATSDYSSYYQKGLSAALPQANTSNISGYEQGPQVQAPTSGYKYDPAQVQALQARSNNAYDEPYKSVELRQMQAAMKSGSPLARSGAMAALAAPSFGGRGAAANHAQYMDWLAHQNQPTQNVGDYKNALAQRTNLANPTTPTGISGYDQMPQTQSVGQGFQYNPAQLQSIQAAHTPAPAAAPAVDNTAASGIDAYGGRDLASGGIAGAAYNLGGYSDGGRLLKGPGDGVSDSIPAVIGKKQPARLADGEFVVPARIVSELGNGSTEAGARKLYAMMDRVQKTRGKTVGKGKVATNSKADKHLPA